MPTDGPEWPWWALMVVTDLQPSRRRTRNNGLLGVDLGGQVGNHVGELKLN